jgi:hypothetical protein
MWKRGFDRVSAPWLALPFVVGAVFANVFPSERTATQEY